MDLFRAEQLNSGRWSKAKLGALLCFAVACLLLGASLLTPESSQVAGENRLMTGSVGQGR